jgi:hypothetical protein
MTASNASRSAAAADTVLTEQDAVKLAAVYMYTVWNWAVYVEEIVEAINAEADPRFTNTNKTAVNSMLHQLEQLGLLASAHINGERKLTWQSYFSLQDGELEEDAEAAFIAAVAPLLAPGAKVTTRSGGTGPRYTESQLKAGHAARVSGAGWKAVAEAAGVRSPSYFSRVLRATFPQMEHQREYNSLSQAEKQALGS